MITELIAELDILLHEWRREMAQLQEDIAKGRGDLMPYLDMLRGNVNRLSDILEDYRTDASNEDGEA